MSIGGAHEEDEDECRDVCYSQVDVFGSKGCSGGDAHDDRRRYTVVSKESQEMK